MKFEAQQIPHKDTGYFSTIVTDYLDGAEALRPFYAHPPAVEGIQAAIEVKRKQPLNRTALAAVLRKQYEAVTPHEKVQANIEALLHENTFTICTAHQPNIFTGPLYFIYKIIHAIKLAAELERQIPGCRFVPVYYMGSEDADLDELGNLTINGTKLQWQTAQTGAVGRMKVDKELMQLGEAIAGQVSFLPHGQEIVALLRSCYKEGATVEAATFQFINKFFEQYGLLVLLPDNPELKRLFVPVMENELEYGFSHPLVEATAAELARHYKVQASGREINLFYLSDGIRNRITRSGDEYAVVDTELKFTKAAILKELSEHPERFSPNVILRGVFQETILPNIAFIGGGGELAYWLELKRVFEAVNVPFPVLALRNSFMLMEAEQAQKLEKAGITAVQLFLPLHQLEAVLVKKLSQNRLHLDAEKAEQAAYYERLQTAAATVDATLTKHVAALHAKALKKVEALEQKMLRAEKRKHADGLRQVTKIKAQLFPGNGLQERVENMIPFYARFGTAFLNGLLDISPGLSGGFVVVG